MSRVVYFDCANGASGDMLLGALVDLGLPLDALRSELAKLGLPGWRLEARRVSRAGLQATKVDVVVDDDNPRVEHRDRARSAGDRQPGHEGQAGRRHDHGHGAQGHSHHHEHGGAGPAQERRTHSHAPHAHGASHEHRGLREILGLLEHSALAQPVKDRCATAFRRLAEAEAAAHGTTPDEVHFHEVGAVDSIVDVVGGVWGLMSLGAERFVASPLNLGTGTVSMSHGTFPVPPPATARLVQGVPVLAEGAGEMLTPTGALLVTSFAASYGPLPAMRIEAVGYGAGSRDLAGRPNALRVVVGVEEAGDATRERLLLLEAEVDDMSPQLVGALLETLLDQGALDAFAAPVHMKKGRPGLLLSVLARPEMREALEETLFRESTTLGVRATPCDRTALAREVVAVETAYGRVGVKIGRRGGRVYNAQPEFDDCRRAAEARGVPVKEVWAAALGAWRRGAGQP